MTRLVGERAHLVSCTGTDKDVDFVRAYKLVDQSKLDAYAKAFAVEDTKFQGTLVNKVCSPGSLCVQHVRTEQVLFCCGAHTYGV